MAKRKSKKVLSKGRAAAKAHIHDDASGIFIPAGLFIGLGLGGFAGQWGAGVLLGLGLGFLAMALVKLNKK